MGYIVAASCGAMSALVIRNEHIDISHKIFLLIGLTAMFYINIKMSKHSEERE